MRNDHPNPTPADASPSASSSSGVWTEERIRALGTITDLPTAGRIFGLGRARSYELARTDQFPVPILPVGARYRVPVAGILAALGLAGTSGDLTTTTKRSVDHPDDISSSDPPHRDPEPGQGAP